jgi:type III pantothenate kinase
MIVLIDIGNTRTKYCIVNNNNRNSQKAILNKYITKEYLTENFISATRVIVASVNHGMLTDKINDWCQNNKVAYKQIVSEIKKGEVVSGYEKPSQLGVDRWLTLIGAAELFPNKNVLIIDAGTATTIDFLSATGHHQGGWILAGIKALISTVLSETTHVKANDNEKESLFFGINTSENVHNAAWAATVGAVNLAILQVQNQGLILDELIITGGNGQLLSSLISHQNIIIEELVFSGLQTYI